MSTSSGTSRERIAELIRIRDENARRSGRQPGQMDLGAECLVFRRHPESGRQADLLRWGLVPNWAADQATAHQYARAETITELPSFSESFRKRRCILPSSEFVQHRTIGSPRGQAIAFGMADGSQLFAAGIWGAWRDAERGEWIRTFAIITVDPNDMIGSVHDRMPALLRRDQFPAWFGEVPASEEDLLGMLRPFPAAAMVSWPARSKRPPLVRDEPREPDLFAARY